MYGLLNRAIKEMTIESHGPALWRRICELADVVDDDFASMQQYPDSLTYRLVGAFCAETGLATEEVLERFGEFWIRHTGARGYEELLDVSGRTLPQLLGNLDNLHARLALSFPDLVPPMFSVSDETDSSLSLHYHSHRDGLGPVVLGVLKGLGDRFALDLELRRNVLPPALDGRVHEVFEVKWRARNVESRP